MDTTLGYQSYSLYLTNQKKVDLNKNTLAYLVAASGRKNFLNGDTRFRQRGVIVSPFDLRVDVSFKVTHGFANFFLIKSKKDLFQR
jgi:hypothetical protein